MFTGIIEEIGHVNEIKNAASSAVLTITAKKVLEGTRLGDSIAVNGVCLTVTGIHGGTFTADVMHETLNRSSLGNLKRGSTVNLERAMAADGRFGGHIVSGHIDGVGRIQSMVREDNAVWVAIEAPESILRLVIEKGSIAIDGISLTVAYVDSSSFKVSIIPHTASETTLLGKNVGDEVNLENDVIGKYVEKLMNYKSDATEKKSGIDMNFLAQHGFMS